MNFNKAFVLGNVTRDPELRHTPSGQSVASFGVATNRVWKSPSGEQKSQVEFHNIVAWGRLGEICGQYLKKGGLVFIEGRIQTRSWQDQQGQKKFWTEIVAETMQMGPKRGGGAEGEEARSQTPEPEEVATVQYPPNDAEEELKPDEIPF
ncbi:MAG: single-stranded DNA-binding protein [bacterium]|nr:single-stranded DNA-binding protein [bacterium]